MRIGLVVSAIVLAPAGASAQLETQRGVALVHVEGEVSLDDQAAKMRAAPSLLADGSVLRTGQGRAAVALKRGGLLILDVDTAVRVWHNGVYNFNRIEVLAGTAIVASATSTPTVECESAISLSDGGLFRFDAKTPNAAGERHCQFRVFEGAAAVPLVSVTVALRAGQTMMCNRRCGDMVPTVEFARDQLDDFDRWARQIGERFRR